jgi:hypothetical protein
MTGCRRIKQKRSSTVYGGFDIKKIIMLGIKEVL